MDHFKEIVTKPVWNWRKQRWENESYSVDPVTGSKRNIKLYHSDNYYGVRHPMPESRKNQSAKFGAAVGRLIGGLPGGLAGREYGRRTNLPGIIIEERDKNKKRRNTPHGPVFKDRRPPPNYMPQSLNDGRSFADDFQKQHFAQPDSRIDDDEGGYGNWFGQDTDQGDSPPIAAR